MQEQAQPESAAGASGRQLELEPGGIRQTHLEGNYTRNTATAAETPAAVGRMERASVCYLASFGVKPMICTPAPRATSIASTTS